MIDCRDAGETLLVAGASAAEGNAELRGHLVGCAQCRRLVTELARLDGELRDLPRIDAPDALADKTAAQIAAANGDPPPSEAHPTGRQPAWLTAFAASVVVISTVGLTFNLWQSPQVGWALHATFEFEDSDAKGALPASGLLSYERVAPGIADPSSMSQPVIPMSGAAAPVIASSPRPESEGMHNRVDEIPARLSTPTGKKYKGRSTKPNAPARAAPQEMEEDLAHGFGADSVPMERAIIAQNEPRPVQPPPAPAVVGLELAGRQTAPVDDLAPSAVEELLSADTVGARVETQSLSAEPSGKRDTAQRPRHRRALAELAKDEEVRTQALRRNREMKRASEQAATKVIASLKETLKNDGESARQKPRSLSESPALPAVTAKLEKGAGKGESLVLGRRTADKTERRKRAMLLFAEKSQVQGLLGTQAKESAGGRANAPRGHGQLERSRMANAAEVFLRSLETLEGQRFQQAGGYWQNTYIPGDPAMRLLGERLVGRDENGPGTGSVLDHAASPNAQPFDPPLNAAMALYLQADKRAIAGPARLRLQVGLSGAQRQGHRPAMNVGVVLNLGDTPVQTTVAPVRALLAALRAARQPGDRFSLTVAGPGGGLLVAPGDFRHGPLSVALAGLLGAPGRHPPSARVSLAQAADIAYAQVRAEDDPGAVLGSSLVLLVTAQALARDLVALESTAHENAAAGIPLSVVNVGRAADLHKVDRLAAAGQGNRRFLRGAEDAAALVDKELHSASRAVARAARLRIRLAANVDLIGIHGSRRLGEPQVIRVKEAERSIDRRMAGNLGIKADRGEDEDGIQIVIPTFYAGDTHIIMLDVVARQPGPVADVTLRFKDLVYLKNGVARAELRIAGGSRAAGPLQRNVLKNRVALELATAARSAGAQLVRGDRTGAVNTLAAMQRLMLDLRSSVPGWTTDAELLGDAQRLAGYIETLQTPAAAGKDRQRRVADSLRYMAFRRLMPEPGEPRP